MMTKTIPRNDSTKQLNEIVDEIYHIRDPLNSPPTIPRRNLTSRARCGSTLLNLGIRKNQNDPNNYFLYYAASWRD